MMKPLLCGISKSEMPSQKANMIYVIGDGKIIEKGDHKRLMSKNGLYSHLVELQKLGDLRE